MTLEECDGFEIIPDEVHQKKINIIVDDTYLTADINKNEILLEITFFDDINIDNLGEEGEEFSPKQVFNNKSIKILSYSVDRAVTIKTNYTSAKPALAFALIYYYDILLNL